MSRCAVVNTVTGAVISVIMADADDPDYAGSVLIPLTDEPVDQSWVWTGDSWTAPEVPYAPPHVGPR